MRVSGSIRARIVASALVGSSIVLVLSSVLVYVLVKSTLVRQFDAALLGRAHAIAALCEVSGDAITFEPATLDLPEFKTGARESFEIWSATGSVVARSASLGAGDLGFAVPSPGRPRASWHRAGDRRARMVRLAFQAHPDRPAVGTRPELAGVIAVARDAGELLHVLRRLRLVLLGVWIASAAVLAGVLSWATRRGLAPLVQLATDVGTMDESTLRRPVARAEGMPSELVPVTRALGGMLARLDAAFTRERALVSDIAHEMRTPLAGLRATIEVALMERGAASAERPDFERCLAIVRDLQTMIENLLELARLESGQATLRVRPIDPNALARECWGSFGERAAGRGIRASWRLAGAVALGDPDKLRIVFGNLFANAVTYADPGTEITVESAVDGGTYRLEVANSGCAIDAADAELPFARFWRADAARTGDGTHCGLGLPLSREIVQLQHGTLRARCERGGRFTVELTLPLVQATETEAT